jgi:hypothetical protein
MRFYLSFLLFSLIAFALTGHTASALPAIHGSEITSNTDLGAWDDVFFCKQNSQFFLLRGGQLYTASIANLNRPVKVMVLPMAKTAHIVTSTAGKNQLWLFWESDQHNPFATEIHSKKIVHFDAPRVKPDSHGSSIQSHVIVEHAQAALLMIAGGTPESWPRKENRPLYFWMSLESGKVISLPVGWDLHYFSADQKVAVFWKTYKSGEDNRPEQPVDMKTGKFLSEVPDSGSSDIIPFIWYETQAIKPLQTKSQMFFAGISFNGAVFPMPSLSGYGYLTTAKANDDVVGFRLRKEGELPSTSSPFWLMQLKPHQVPKLIANNVTDFVMLDGGNCVYTTSNETRPFSSYNTEAFFHLDKDNSQWNLLDGVKRLPPLNPELKGKDYIRDAMTVRLTTSIDTNKPAVFCVFTHSRGDERSFPTTMPFTPALSRTFWQRAMIVTSTGERYMTPLFREDKSPSWSGGMMPSHIWFNNSGKIILGNNAWESSAQKTTPQIHLFEITLHFE